MTPLMLNMMFSKPFGTEHYKQTRRAKASYFYPNQFHSCTALPSRAISHRA